MKVLYMKITSDEYELPVAVAETMTDLAQMLCVTVSSVSLSLKKYYTGERNTPYRKVILDD